MSGVIEKVASGAATTGKSFIAAHPVTMAIVGGAIIAGGAYYWMQKRKAAEAEVEPEAAEVDAAEAA